MPNSIFTPQGNYHTTQQPKTKTIFTTQEHDAHINNELSNYRATLLPQDK